MTSKTEEETKPKGKVISRERLERLIVAQRARFYKGTEVKK